MLRKKGNRAQGSELCEVSMVKNSTPAALRHSLQFTCMPIHMAGAMMGHHGTAKEPKWGANHPSKLGPHARPETNRD
ncbi:hypothetical protein VNO77_38830 [Canavalia gladiata]|uniref:Uncharacterized protein n=1 Tax=Canavalia gladiata TaxID=3824 RepID=A0AAN9PWK9_CANGL